MCLLKLCKSDGFLERTVTHISVFERWLTIPHIVTVYNPKAACGVLCSPAWEQPWECYQFLVRCFPVASASICPCAWCPWRVLLGFRALSLFSLLFYWLTDILLFSDTDYMSQMIDFTQFDLRVFTAVFFIAVSNWCTHVSRPFPYCLRVANLRNYSGPWKCPWKHSDFYASQWVF